MSSSTLLMDTATADEAVPLPLWRMSIERYHRMIQAGVLTADDQVELLEGLLVAKMNESPRHCAAGRLVRLRLEAVVPEGWFVDTQDPITLADSEPEPGVSVANVNRIDLLDRHPGADEVALVVEISDTSLARDREAKGRIYAAAGVPVYWIVNLVDECVEVLVSRRPSGLWSPRGIPQGRRSTGDHRGARSRPHPGRRPAAGVSLTLAPGVRRISPAGAGLGGRRRRRRPIRPGVYRACDSTPARPRHAALER